MVLISIMIVKKSEIPKTCHNNMSIKGKSRSISNSGAARLQYMQSNYQSSTITINIYNKQYHLAISCFFLVNSNFNVLPFNELICKI